MVERLVSDEDIARFTREPPEGTRAWTRAMLLRRAGAADVDAVDWDMIRIKVPSRTNPWPRYRTVELARPDRFTRAAAQPIFDQAEDLEALVDGLTGLGEILDCGEDHEHTRAAAPRGHATTDPDDPE
jgi:hypothetical protein